ncbi:hypothetical protein DSO57_1037012 [Entomophthora muscae]|uniref:Uncharacterized protein n=1 Tax=Entomophthora muscae TaxID=34485 RepID=A0ACC2S171_9FUNG|nr:hypothetical protein DSO57_1037012 [Entomophthora muscae]
MAQEEPAPRPPQDGAAQEPEPWYMQVVSSLGRMILIYTVINFIKTNFSATQPQTTSNGPAGAQKPPDPSTSKATLAKPIWNFGSSLSLRVYISENEEYNHKSPGSLFWESNPVQFGDWKFSETKSEIRRNL